MKVIKISKIRSLDEKAIDQAQIKSEILMKNAGRGCVDEIEKYLETLPKCHKRRIIVICGKGNNGGDGFVIARILAEEYDLRVIVLSILPLDDYSGAAHHHAMLLPDSVQYDLLTKESLQICRSGDIIIDALLGTGTTGMLRSPYKEMITAVNNFQLPVIAIDIPSGLNGDTGQLLPEAIKAVMTLTLAFPKPGLFSEEALNFCGFLRLVEIGIPRSYSANLSYDFNALFEQDIIHCLSCLKPTAHKGTQGRVLVIGGSSLYKGAPLLAGSAALRCGSGLVTVNFPQSSNNTLSHPLSLIVQSVEDNGKGSFSEESIPYLTAQIEKNDVAIIGPGMSCTDSTVNVVSNLLSTDATIILDADGINCLCISKTIPPNNKNIIITPHPGEMKRLLKAFDLENVSNSPRKDQATALAHKLNVIVVLKGPQTIIAAPSGEWHINTSGSPSLATAGTGDVLTGMIASFIGQDLPIMKAVCTAVFIHGRVAENTSEAMRGFTADDLIKEIPATLKSISPFA